MKKMSSFLVILFTCINFVTAPVVASEAAQRLPRNQLPPSLKVCTVDSDCVEVRASCCCSFEAINQKKMDEYKKLHNELCKNFKIDCQCERHLENPVCQNGICELQ